MVGAITVNHSPLGVHSRNMAGQSEYIIALMLIGKLFGKLPSAIKRGQMQRIVTGAVDTGRNHTARKHGRRLGKIPKNRNSPSGTGKREQYGSYHDEKTDP